MDENKKKLDELKKEYDQVVSDIQKMLKKDNSKTLVEYQQKIAPLLARKDELIKSLDAMYKVVKVDFENERKQLKIREAEIKKQTKAQKNRKR